MGTPPPLSRAVCTRKTDTALGGSCVASGAGVIISARHLMCVTVTAGAILLFLGQEVWKIESGVWESSFSVVALMA